MKNLVQQLAPLVLPALLCLLSMGNGWSQGTRPFVIGESFTMHSTALGEERTIHVGLPIGYDPDSAARYPVVYLLDGSADEDFIHIAGLLQFASFPWIAWCPPSILVGISNVDRQRDFTFPTTIATDKEKYPTTGGSAAFLRFVADELKPAIEGRYRTGGTNTLIGQSLGGLLATQFLFQRPGTFQHYIIVSPSLWWDDQSLLKQPMEPLPAGTKVYVAVGKEGPSMVPPAKRLYALVKGKAWAEFGYFPDVDHANILHIAAHDALRWLGSSPKRPFY